MLYRQRVLLALLEKWGDSIQAIHFQKLLFLFCRNQGAKPAYDFVPYEFGCFSFLSYADKRSLIRAGLLTDDEKKWALESQANEYNRLTGHDKAAIDQTISFAKPRTQDELFSHVYATYPHYAQNSRLREKYLPNAPTRPDNLPTTHNHLFSIGYEGKSVDKYFDLLLLNDVKVLCDVRKNAFSMKYGFSKSQLKSISSRLGIEYIHFPELGIQSDKRQDLKDQADYDRLFEDYEANHLGSKQETLAAILELTHKHARIALTCFEANPAQCHRTRVANAILHSDKTGLHRAEL